MPGNPHGRPAQARSRSARSQKPARRRRCRRGRSRGGATFAMATGSWRFARDARGACARRARDASLGASCEFGSARCGPRRRLGAVGRRATAQFPQNGRRRESLRPGRRAARQLRRARDRGVRPDDARGRRGQERRRACASSLARRRWREWYDEAQAFVTDQTSAAGGWVAAARGAHRNPRGNDHRWSQPTTTATPTASARTRSASTPPHPAAQRWFDRGCVRAFAFHREEAAHCFGEAAKADPACAMAQWGSRSRTAPTTTSRASRGTTPLGAQPAGYLEPQRRDGGDRTRRRARGGRRPRGAPPRERALIDAMATRYEWPMTGDGTPALQQTYADAMAKGGGRVPRRRRRPRRPRRGADVPLAVACTSPRRPCGDRRARRSGRSARRFRRR